MQGSTFEKVNLDAFDARKIDFVDCRFESVVFGDRHLGLIQECSFAGCTFARSRFDAVTFVKTQFQSCRFDDMKGTRVRWEECKLENSTLSGKLEKANFIDTAFRHVAMTSVQLSDCLIIGGERTSLQFPDEPRNFVVDPRVMVAAAAKLAPKLSAEALANYRHFAEGALQLGPMFPINFGILTSLSDEDRELVVATLYEMRNSPVS